MNADDGFDFLAMLASVCGGFALFAFLLYWTALTVFALHNESECLRAGYPRSEVTWSFQGYCLTLDGAVQPKVIKRP